MPTIFSHPAVPLALGLGLGQTLISRRLMVAGAVASIVPDLDVVAFRLGIPYAHDLGHRGLSHSIFFALFMGLIALLLAKNLHASRRVAFAFTALAAASHGLLDMCTNGGLGVAYFWPFSSERLFLPLHPIKVSPIGLHDFLTTRGPGGFALRGFMGLGAGDRFVRGSVVLASWWGRKKCLILKRFKR